MKNKIGTAPLLMLFVSFFAIQAMAQESYHHFTGKLETGESAYANLIVADTSVSGYFEVGSLWQLPLYMAGSLKEGAIILTSDGDFPVSFEGNYDATGTISGQLHESRAIHPLQLDEECKEDCLPFEVLSRHSMKSLSNDAGSPIAVFNAGLLIAKGTSGNNLNNIIQKKFFKIKEPVPVKAVLPAAEGEFFNQYTERNASINTPENYARLNWEQSRIMRVIFNRNKVVALAMHDYAYTGGSSGLKITRFLVYDIINESPILLSDLIKAESMPALSGLISGKLKQDLGLPPTEALNNHGFYTAEIYASENFYITGNGLVFHYNSYEIASDKGETDVLVPWEQLKGMLKKEVL